MLISDLMRWLRVDLFFERSKRFIRWFIRLLPLRKINEELWFFTFLLSFVSSNKLARQGLTDANRSIPNRKTGTEPSSQKDGPSMCPGFLHRFSGLVSGWIVYGNPCSEQGLTQESKDQNRLVQDQAFRSGPENRLDEDQQKLRNLGPTKFRKSPTKLDWSVPKPGRPWIPGLTVFIL